MWKRSSFPRCALQHMHMRGCKELLGHIGTGHAKSSQTGVPTPGPERLTCQHFPNTYGTVFLLSCLEEQFAKQGFPGTQGENRC